MRGNRTLTAVWVLVGGHDANELHHASIFVREDVTVKDECSGEVHEGMTNSNPPWCNRLSVCRHDRRRDGDYILPDEVISRLVCVVGGETLWVRRCNWRVDLDYLKRIDMDMKRMRGALCVIFQNPVLQSVFGHALIDRLAKGSELFAIDHEVRREGGPAVDTG